MQTSKPEGRRGFGGFGVPPNRQKKEETSRKVPVRSNNVSLKENDFQMAIIRGHRDLVEKYLEDGGPVDTVLKSGWTGATYAANIANTAILTLLLERGANCNYHKEQYTVLMAACGATGKAESDVLACVELLLPKGAKVNTFDRYHITPLMYAAREGRAQVIRKLAEAGADLNKQDNMGWTALTWAVSKKQPLAVKTLVQLNADLTKKHADGQTVIDYAYMNSMDEMLEILEGKKRVDSYTPSSSSAAAAATTGPAIRAPSTVQKTSVQGETTSSSESAGTRYGELELFLCGLDLSQLIGLFHSQHVDFYNLLRMTEPDLIQMGVSQLGVRKKILDGIHAVHKKDWESTSLPTLSYKKQISCAEALAVVANISKHMKYICTTLGYLGDQVRANPAMLDELQDGTGSKQLMQHTTDTVKNVESLHKQLKSLQQQLNKDISLSDPPDVIKNQTEPSRGRYRHALIVISGPALGLLVWKRQTVWNQILHWLSRPAD